ncbi:hypothetical protein DPMN_033535 [Dreissena polymorpha]|uniref:Uncharacterized protein n=1 Tax=Dreissena polymorpha TaxID=45954 RepID=A0A9D4M508_DREPO|nr:hypothetical protein DPMN_033535 [Dreissena polymorpha]
MAIGGFPLTGRNYQSAIELLRERYGQTHKIIDNFMTLLLEAPTGCATQSYQEPRRKQVAASGATCGHRAGNQNHRRRL